MTAPKASPPSIAYRHNVADGRHEIGVKLDGVFLVFASVENDIAAQKLEREKGASAAAGEAAEEDED